MPAVRNWLVNIISSCAHLMFAERAERGGEGGGRDRLLAGEGGGREQLLGLKSEVVICVREEIEE